MEQKKQIKDMIRVAGDPVLLRVVEKTSALNKVKEKMVQVLMIERPKIENKLFAGYYSLPGCAAVAGENLEETVLKKLQEKTSIDKSKIRVKKFNVFYEPDRDPRNHVIGVSFYSIIPQNTLFNLAENAFWIDYEEIKDNKFQIAFDHKKIIETAVKKVKRMLRISPIALMFLKEKFTLGELHAVFTAFNENIAPPNLLRDFSKLEYISKTEEKEENVYKRNKGFYYIKSKNAEEKIIEMYEEDYF